MHGTAALPLFKMAAPASQIARWSSPLDLPVSKHCVENGHSEWDLRCMAVDHIPPLSRGGDRSTWPLKKVGSL